MSRYDISILSRYDIFAPKICPRCALIRPLLRLPSTNNTSLNAALCFGKSSRQRKESTESSASFRQRDPFLRPTEGTPFATEVVQNGVVRRTNYAEMQHLVSEARGLESKKGPGGSRGGKAFCHRTLSVLRQLDAIKKGPGFPEPFVQRCVSITT